MKAIVQVENLRKQYEHVVAVDGVSFEVYEGEIFGMVGPNGAGKTTTIECIEGLRSPDEGVIRILGMDQTREGAKVRQRIGIQLQESNLQPRLKVWEALDLFASFYDRSIDWNELLEQFGLSQQRNAFYENLSGGQKQRLFIALALINDPDIIFLDELTTGLDPQARLNMWDMVKAIREQGKTIFLTTHYMEEAERLCDRVAIIDQGRIVALDTPANLVRQLNAPLRVEFEPIDAVELETLKALPTATFVEKRGEMITLYGRDEQLIVDVVKTLTNHRIRFRHLQIAQPSLEDVFLTLTGKRIDNND
ncbi:MAG: ABC transporter ATP-binding protein [Chloroflexi bacterium]|nr:ABC transporter ATP-binding protein [Chloroflexota bacterium]